MPRFSPAMIEVYLFRRHARKAEFLVLQRSNEQSLPGVWQPVTGKLRRGESALDGAIREVREETGIEPKRWWRLETPTVYYDEGRDALCFVLLFAAEIAAGDGVRLSREHRTHRFLDAREASRRFLWDSQRRGIAAVRRQVVPDGRHAQALEITQRVRRR